VIEVRWWLGRGKGFKRLSLGHGVRDESGRVVPDLEQAAVRRTQEIYDALMAGRSLTTAAPADEGPLTLEQGFEIAMTVPTGMYVVESEHLREVRRAARDIVSVIGQGPSGAPRTWDSLSHSAVRELWLKLADRFVKTGRGGPAWTERCAVVLIQVAQWLAAEERTTRSLTVKKNWREQMRREWEQLTSKRIVRRAPRHTPDEIRRIFRALDNPKVDPRISLAVELGAEARLGQVRRLRRSDVDLSPVGAFGLGRVTVHGAGKKLGVTRDLTPEERAAIDRALSGYLLNLEQARISGDREDYPMFPAGRLRYDLPPSRLPRRKKPNGTVTPVRRAPATVRDAPMAKRTLVDLFHDLERVAKVKVVEGRGWYGIRRRAADVFEDYETDERVLNDQTGHRHSETRREIYQERDREVIRAKSAQTRRRVRTEAFGHATLQQSGQPLAEKSDVKGARPAAETASNGATHTPPHTPAPRITVDARGRKTRQGVVR
jgi:hypothetical protein